MKTTCHRQVSGDRDDGGHRLPGAHHRRSSQGRIATAVATWVARRLRGPTFVARGAWPDQQVRVLRAGVDRRLQQLVVTVIPTYRDGRSSVGTVSVASAAQPA